MIATTSTSSSPSSYPRSPSQHPRHARPSLYTTSPALPAATSASNFTSTSTAPAAIPKPAFSIRSAPSPSADDSTSSAASALATPWPLPPRSPKRPTRDSATQYSPPPTAQARPVRSPSAPPQAIDRSQAVDSPHAVDRPHPPGHSHPGAATAASADQPPANLAVQEPLEPRVRLTPHPQHGVTGTVRRSHSSLSPASGHVSTTPSSPTKRARKPMADAIVMPRDYAKCDAKELAVVISDMLLELIRVNDEIPLQDGQLTRFHSRAPPGISVRDYLHRITYHATLPPPILLAMVTYVDKLCAMFPAFRINSLTVHRFLITAATVASKGLSDSFWTNSTYSKVGGVSIKELALLELELLERVEWRIVPQPEVLVDYYASLVERSDRHVLADEDDGVV